MSKTAAFVGAISLAIVVALVLASRKGSLAAVYDKQREAEHSLPHGAQPIITEASIASLPAPVQRYLRVTGNVGKPRIAKVLVKFDTELFNAPGQSGMRGPSDQYDRFDKPKRLFFMETRMFGLPVAVLHDYDGTRASMRVRIASLFDIADLQNEALAKAETVTILNDLCAFAPSWFIDPRLTWRSIDDRHAGVSFQNGPYQVSATLAFNEHGELVNFVSDDRAALQPDGTLRQARWSTPLHDYKPFGGRRVPGYGEAIWNYPEGDFTYGRFTVRDANFDLQDSDS